MNVKKKGLLKGFKYFSQIFDEEDQHKGIQIGLPTDVKHVAHIGWDGPSAGAAPSWMDDFKSANGGYQSAPLESSTRREDGDNKRNSQEKGHKSNNSNPGEMDTVANERNMPTLPKASRRHQSMDSITLPDSPVGSPTTSHQAAKNNKDKDSKKEGNRRRKEKTSKLKEGSDEEASSQAVPSIPKKLRRKKPKDPEAKGSKISAKRGAKNRAAQESEEALEEEQVEE